MRARNRDEGVYASVLLRAPVLLGVYGVVIASIAFTNIELGVTVTASTFWPVVGDSLQNDLRTLALFSLFRDF